MDQLRALRALVRVVDEGSFAGAARSLNAAPAVVTRLVADLEQQLGARLLHRTTRRLTLTPVGAEYLERTRQILSDLDEANTLAGDASASLKGGLRIAGPLPFLQLRVMPHLPDFLARHPGIEFSFSVTEATLALGPDENADLSILLAGERPLDGDFIARPLLRAEIVMCATPAYLARHGRPLRPEDLQTHQLLIPCTAAAPQEWVLHRKNGQTETVGAHQLKGPRPVSSITSANSPLLLSAAMAGLGIAGTLEFLVEQALKDGRMERVLPDWSIGSYTAYAAMPSRRLVPRRTRVFLDFLTERLAAQQAREEEGR